MQAFLPAYFLGDIMREINVQTVRDTVKELVIRANKILPDDLCDCIKCGQRTETDELPKKIMGELINNLDCANELDVPICQDTGMAVIFIEIGQDVHFVGGDLYESINSGVADGYTDGLLRKSVVRDPLDRVNTQDNTPAVIHTKIVAGESVKIKACPKGFGSENMSKLKMFTPSATKEDLMNFVLDTVKSAGGNPCPPMVVGVGFGGDFEQCAYLAKEALCREVSVRNSNPVYSEMEAELLKRINETDIGPQGFGGKTTALAVNIEVAPTHIAGLPAAVNIGCHVTRHAEKTI